MTPFVWMFIKNYENLRNFIINHKSISSLIQLEYSAFSEATVPICTFVLSNFDENYAGIYLKLSEFTGGMEVQKEKVLQIISGDEILNDKNKFVTNQLNFDKIPGNSIAYWVDESILNLFDNPNIYSASISASQNVTGNNKKYLRYFWEVNKNKINKEVKWIFYAKGGGYRKWIGNMINVIDWSPEAREVYRTGHASQIVPEEYWYQKGITWGLITSSKPSFRVLPEDSTFDKGGSSIFIKNDDEFNYILGLLNSNLFFEIVKLFNPTLNFQVKDIRSMPLVIENIELINGIVEKCCEISNNDWNDYEISYNFEKHPFIRFEGNNLSEIFLKWENYKEKQFNLLKNNEIEINKIFSEIYNIDINCNVDDENISIITSDYISDVKSFISFAVGCMFGRYSLDNDGIQFAGGEFNINNYNKFIPDDDNIIPVLDSEYFEDDIVGRFVEFVKVCFGEEHLEENLDFIANALAKNKKPSRAKIREYIVKNFFNDHKKTYKKCPIYWQFSSGKQNGFNCIVYMHRYEPSLVARIRTDYLHKTQKAIEQAIVNCDNIINHSSSNSEITKATKDKNKLQKQLQETIEYDEALAHIANQNIEIDLDDGVKVNYAKFQNVKVFKEGKKSKKINLLKKL